MTGMGDEQIWTKKTPIPDNKRAHLTEDHPSIRHWELCEKTRILFLNLPHLGDQNTLHSSKSVLILKPLWKLGQPIFK